MAFSSLARKIMGTSKAESRRGTKVSRVIVHHWAGMAGGVQRLVHSKDKASSNYIIENGLIVGSVSEALRAWTSGSFAADAPSITVEVQNSTLAPGWEVSDANYNQLVRLIADIADRHKWGRLTRDHVRGHREFAATACPGPYLWARMDQIVKDAQAIRDGKTPVASKPKPTTPAPSKPRQGRVPGTDIIVAADGAFGAYTIRALQSRLRTLGYTGHHIDGDFGPYSVRSLQRWLRAKGYTSHHIDGDFGPYTIRALQTWLRGAGYREHAIDGDFGRYTITALQHALIDGKVK